MKILSPTLSLFLLGQFCPKVAAYINSHFDGRFILASRQYHDHNDNVAVVHGAVPRQQPQHQRHDNGLGICDKKFGMLCSSRKRTSQPLIALSSSVDSNGSNDEATDVETRESIEETQETRQVSPQQSLSDMEDQAEVRLDRQEQMSSERNSAMNDNNSNLNMQLNERAPTTMDSSSNHMNNQEDVFRNEDRAKGQREDKIREILEKDDAEYRERMKKERFGKFANAKNADDWKMLEKEESDRVRRENEQKTEIAKKSGVTFTLLENEPDSWDEEDEDKPTRFRARKKGKPSWVTELDADMNSELQRIGVAGSESSSPTAAAAGNVGPRFVNGKLVVNRDEGDMGIRVGSAGGWSLEVFPGDFVVHRKYGIGKYDRTIVVPKTKLSDAEVKLQTEARENIMRTLVREGKAKDEIQSVVRKFGTEEDNDPDSFPKQTVLEVSYADAKVRIPVDRAYRLSRFRAGDAAVKPRLSRVKGEAWAKAKKKVELETIEMAQEVLALYAKRETFARPPFNPAKEVKVRDFEETFPYVPTKDQNTCFENVENDMVWRNRPMDRLVCGDVGFGKTEVALRALYRCVANGRQAALLSPTGVLASQHMKTVVGRMGPDTPFNVKIALLRGGMGKNTKVGKALREEITSGGVDLVVGTHALLSSGLSFKNLGLLVVDEEQRFGVKQKERLKLIFDGIDVLTLSATPIPRTLQMSLSGIRDTSTIMSPPPLRKPTITYVQEFDKQWIRDGISREIDRGGQVFYVVSRINQLEKAEEVIKELFPDIRVIQAHGRMARGGAEANVAAFAEGEYDVLLATTVIENGVDIPSVNTIIIQNAQSFGMSTLYQLRGRVGRSPRQAYAYFLHKAESITEQSAMRLQAMADLDGLGAGFDVANRDLEIRGAGSLLGTEQSGLASKVGFDLYMRMLKKSIRQLRGLDLPMVPRTNVLLPNAEGSLEISQGGGNGNDGSNTENEEVSHAFVIPESFIEDDDERFKQEGLARLSENTNQLVQLTEAWKKVYGPLPRVLQDKLKTLHLHACTRTLGIDLIAVQDNADGTFDGILRCAGLRPRCWLKIRQLLPKKTSIRGLDVIFPPRYHCDGDKEVYLTGGKPINTTELLIDSNDSKEEDTDDDWDAVDEDEVHTQNQDVQSATFVKTLAEINIADYPRFVVKNLSGVAEGSRVDALLRVLLPVSKVVYDRQQEDKEKAQVAAELKEKRLAMKKQKKEQELLGNRRSGYRY